MGLIRFPRELEQELFINRIHKLNIRGNPKLDVNSLAVLSPVLSELNIGGNNHEKVPLGLSKLVNLTKLNLSDGNIRVIPHEVITSLTNLRQIAIERNKLIELPQDIGVYWINLEQIHAQNNEITDLLESISKLTNLNALSLHHNKLQGDLVASKLELIYDNLTNLKYLALWSNPHLCSISENISKLVNLEQFSVSKCSLTSFPFESISKLTKLTNLILNNNDIELDECDAHLARLVNLVELDLRQNSRISHLPEYLTSRTSFPRMKKLQHSFAECLLWNSDKKGVLYIGDISTVGNEKHIKKFGITRVLTVCTDTITKFDGIEYMTIHEDDLPHVDLSKYFVQATVFIHNAIDHERQTVLVHCAAGKSRSATLLLAYFMRYHGLSYDEAFEWIHTKRHVGISPNEGFVRQLRTYEQQLDPNRPHSIYKVIVSKKEKIELKPIVEEINEYSANSVKKVVGEKDSMLEQFINLGFQEKDALEALKVTNRVSLEHAIQYLFEHQQRFETKQSILSEFKIQEYKMVLAVRADLGMTKGKIGAQCGHAVLGAYRQILHSDNIQHKEWLELWETIAEAKVCLKVNSDQEITELSLLAKNKGLNAYVVVDAGRTQIASGSKTVLAIGPAPVQVIDEVTKHLKLL